MKVFGLAIILVILYLYATEEDRKSVVQGKSVDLGGRRSIKKKKKEEKEKKKKKKDECTVQ